MSCSVCKVTGIRTCDPEEQDLKCEICGFCARKAITDEFRKDYPSDRDKKLMEAMNDDYPVY